MRRAPLVVAGTIGGLALLAAFHTTPDGSTAGLAAPIDQTTTTTTPRRGTGATTTTTIPAGGTRTIDGPVVTTDYGDVQVRITLQGSKLTDVQAVQLPSDRSRSRRISQQAGPILRTEALQAQSANIDLVSGASYTSDGYARSLQGALDTARR